VPQTAWSLAQKVNVSIKFTPGTKRNKYFPASKRKTFILVTRGHTHFPTGTHWDFKMWQVSTKSAVTFPKDFGGFLRS
jgi:hypothetical protein